MTARPPTTVLLIRHAATAVMNARLSGRLPGVPLDAAGRQQAGDLAAALAPVPLSAIYTSPLARARATAAAIADGRKLTVSVEQELIEIDFGEWTGLPFEQLSLRADWQTYNAARGRGHVPGGEPPAAASARIARVLSALHQRHPGRTIAAVTHAELVRYAILRARNLPPARWADIDVPPASIAILQCDAADVRELQCVGSATPA